MQNPPNAHLTALTRWENVPKLLDVLDETPLPDGVTPAQEEDWETALDTVRAVAEMMLGRALLAYRDSQGPLNDLDTYGQQVASGR